MEQVAVVAVASKPSTEEGGQKPSMNEMTEKHGRWPYSGQVVRERGGTRFDELI